MCGVTLPTCLDDSKTWLLNLPSAGNPWVLGLFLFPFLGYH